MFQTTAALKFVNDSRSTAFLIFLFLAVLADEEGDGDEAEEEERGRDEEHGDEFGSPHFFHECPQCRASSSASGSTAGAGGGV
jgi:hypothetical protein